LTISITTFRTALVLWIAIAALAAGADNNHWVVAWGASPSPQLTAEEMRSDNFTYENQTLREIVHTSVGGGTVRIRLSNAFSKEAVDIGSAHIALISKKDQIEPASDKAITFSGRTQVTIPPDGAVISDPVELKVTAGQDVAVSLFLPKAALGGGIHYAAQQTTYIGTGDQTAAPAISDAKTITSWVFLTDFDVLASNRAATLVAFGDSITDGAHSAIDENHRWPNFLAGRLIARRKAEAIGILDAGIGGNRILHDAKQNVRFGVSALARYDRDVMAQPGLKYVIVLEGINDLGHAGTSAPISETVSAEDLIAGLTQLIGRAHENGVKIFGATLTPFEGARSGYFTPEKEVKRKAVNDWIRSRKGFDGFIDFDKAVRDPAHPDRFLPAYDSGDHLHPSDAGYKAMADVIDLSLFK
jgi:lysophospholipase L1-like esterase